jgi:integrase
VAAFSGLRLGELLALRWRDVDFANAIIHVRRSYVQGQMGAPKSGRVRSVPLIDQAARALDGESRRAYFTGPDDLVFGDVVGEPQDHWALRKRYYSALGRARLTRLRFHDLRHSFGTLAVQVYPVTDVKEYMGHADLATTMGYVHYVPRHNAAALLTRLVEAAVKENGVAERVAEQGTSSATDVTPQHVTMRVGA